MPLPLVSLIDKSPFQNFAFSIKVSILMITSWIMSPSNFYLNLLTQSTLYPISKNKNKTNAIMI